MELFRITQEAYADDLSGNGSYLFGGRWNSEGYFALYTSATRSLALLETLAHTPTKMLLAKTYILLTLHLPDNLTTHQIELAHLPATWGAADNMLATQKMGNQFLTEKKLLLLQVPSVVMPEEKNYIINPLHSAFKKVSILHQRPIVFDNRVAANM
jgi:RES domain-containing protein